MATFDVELTGGAPWGFSMVGGSDFNQPLNISKVILPHNYADYPGRYQNGELFPGHFQIL